MNTFSLAWRNVWRNGRRSGITIAAMSLALLSMLVYSALMQGMLRGSERNLLDLEVGDVQVFALDYRDSPSLYDRVGNADDLIDRLEADGLRATSRMLGSGLVAAGENSAGANFRGVDVERDAAVSRVHERVVSGEWLSTDDPQGVVLGRRIARILGVDIGGELIVVSQAADGSTANDLFEVRGVLGVVADNVDRTGVYMVDDAFRELMAVPDGAHQLIVRRPEGASLAQTAERVKTAAPELDVMTWRELMPMVASMLDSSAASMMIMMLIVYTAIGIVILNAMLMAVFERIREFGVLKAIGVGPGALLQIILFETLVMTACAIAAGLLLSAPALWYLSSHGIDLGAMTGVSMGGMAFDSVWRAEVEPGTFVAPIVTLVAIVAVAGIYPAMRAAFINPLKAMRHR